VDEIKLLNMNILHIAPISKNITSGLSNSVYNLVEAQSHNYNSIGIISSKKTDNYFSKKIKFMQIGDLSIIKLIFFFSINKLLRFFRNPDVIVFHDIYNLRQTILIFKMLYSGKKILITPRGAFSQIALKRSFIKKRIYLYLFLYPIIKKIYAFIALNKGEKKQIQNFIQNKRIIIIGNGVNDNLHIYNKYKHNYDFKEKNEFINIGYFGRFDIHIKGLDILLKALIEYQTKYKSNKIKLIFIGDHVVKSEFNSKKFIDAIRSKLIFPENLVLKGPFHSETKWEELSKIDLLIQPSRTEGMPNSVLEAMSIGIPSCVTKFTNMEEIIKNAKNGWVIDLSSSSIVNFFNDLNNYSKKDLILMGVNGMQYAKKHLLWNKVSISNYK
tara:strand:+ start:1450 stop:2601 length:1152 start_codon:yes stop_codon:yes gene_type:complete